ncbi:MAG: alpha/beta hydrolase, partial [Perlucidibaca sp.]
MSTEPMSRQIASRRPWPDRRPHVICHDNLHNHHVVASLPLLHEAFTPTPWLFNEHAQLIFHSLRKKGRRAAPVYDHEDSLVMADGGRTALFWRGHDLAPDTPTIVLLHTITGSPASMAELVDDLHAGTGWRIVLCLRRGHADLPLTTPRLNILGCTDDLREQLAVIQARFPESPLYGVGSSAGSGLLVRYLGEEGERA